MLQRCLCGDRVLIKTWHMWPSNPFTNKTLAHFSMVLHTFSAWLKANTKQKLHHRSTINRLLWWGLTHWKRKCTPQVSWSFFGAKIMQKMLDTMGSQYRWLSHWAKLSNTYVPLKQKIMSYRVSQVWMVFLNLIFRILIMLLQCFNWA